MAKKRHRRAAQKKYAESPSLPPADAATALWMMAVTAALACEVGATASRVVVELHDDSPKLLLLSELLLFAALVVGGLSLLILPVILFTRRDPPPTVVTVASTLIGAAPLVVYLARALV